jgi:DnaJ homolog subfamily A member 5
VEEEEDESIVIIPAQSEEAQDEMAGLSKKARQKLKKRMKEQEKAAASEAATPEVVSEEEVDTQNASKQPEELTEMPISNGKKSRRAKKDAKFAKERCNVCSTGFDSRSKLFTHIRETGHALAPSTKPSKK